MTSYEERESEEPRGWSPLAVASIATLVLLLGLGGALFGINVANRNKQAGGVPPQSPAPATAAPATPTPAPTLTPASPTPAPTTPTQASTPDSVALPNLAELDFTAARAKVRELKLGWRLIFEGTSTDATVRTTEPAAGVGVRKGDTIKIFVRGAAPLATVPPVLGLACAEAASMIVDLGLYPEYKSGREGVVLSQVPAATDPPLLRWNDQVQITCGKAV